MRANPRFVRLLAIALIVSLVLGACGGGTTESTWFNFPSVKLDIAEDGTASAYGIGLTRFTGGPLLPQPTLQQLQGAGIQRVELRIGSNGIHVYLNGEDMPYVSWDAESADNLQELLTDLAAANVSDPYMQANLANAGMVANYLPWLRRIGLGVRLDLPPGTGDYPRWTGETSVTPETVAETTIGPFLIASLVFEESGAAFVEGLPVAELERLLGSTLPLRLEGDTLAIVDAIGAETLTIATQPNGIDLFLNDQPLPGIAYDSAYLERMLSVVNPLVLDPVVAVLLNQIVPLLPGAEVQVVVSFVGEPAAKTDLGSITFIVHEDGSLTMDSGVPLPGASLPPDILSQLQDANVQHLDVQFQEDTLGVAVNGQALPTISMGEDTADTMASLVAPIAGIEPALITEGLNVIRDIGVDVAFELPASAGAEPVQIPDVINFDMQPAQLGDVNAPTIQLSAKYGPDGFSEFGGISADTLSRLGISLPALPPDLLNTLESQGVSSLNISTGENALNVAVDGETALTVNYDQDSLRAALDLAVPFLGEDSPISRPVLAQLIQEQILPILPSAQVNITLELE